MLASRHLRQHKIGKLRNAGRTSRFGRSFENWQPRHHCRTIGCDARHQGRGKMVWLPGPTRPPDETANHRPTDAPGADEASDPNGKATKRKFGEKELAEKFRDKPTTIRNGH